MHRSRTMTVAAAAALVIAGLVAPAAATAAPAAPTASASIVTKLKHLPGVTLLGTNPNAPGRLHGL